MKPSMKISLVPFNVAHSAVSEEGNMERVCVGYFRNAIERGFGHSVKRYTDLVVFPELWTYDLVNMMLPRMSIANIAKMTDSFVEAAIRQSIALNTSIMLGSFFRQTEHGIKNSAYIRFPNGAPIIQDKLFLTPEEKKWGIVPGDQLNVFDTQFGRVVILIGHDSEFPEISHMLASENIDLIIIPSLTDAFGYTRVRRCAKALAVQHHCYVAVVGTARSRGSRYRQIKGGAAFYAPADYGFYKMPTSPYEPLRYVLDMKMLRESKALSDIEYPARDQADRMITLVKHG